MRLYLKFSLDSNIIPLDYRRMFLSFLKQSISQINDGKYFERYFLNTSRRPYTFSVGFPNPRFFKDCIQLSKKELSVVFSTGDTLTGYIFFSAFINMKNKKFMHHDKALTLVSIQKVKDLSVNSDTAFIKMLSPLCLREHTDNEDKYYSVSSEDFENVAKKVIVQQLLLEGFSENLAKTVSIKPINAKKTVVYHYKNYLETSLGDFMVKGDKSVLNYLLKYGIGSRKSAGFGCVQLLSE